MKKVKIMLLSLTLFAVIGGALAFKAKFTDPFCTAAFNNGCGFRCPNLVASKTTIDPLPQNIYCTTTPTTTTKINGQPVDEPVSTCTTYAEQSPFTAFTLTCNTTKTLIVD